MNAEQRSIESLVQDLEDYCKDTDELSLDELRERIRGIPPDAVLESSFFHHACNNKSVSLEIIECLLDAFPEAARARTSRFCPRGETTTFPVHLACSNPSCPTSAIQLLVGKNPLALRHQSAYSYRVNGLPLHFYLSRRGYLDPAAVSMLVEAYPEALTTAAHFTEFTPIHALLCTEGANTMYDIFQILCGIENSSLRLAVGHGRTPLHIACGNPNLDPRIVQELLDHWPESVNHLDDGGNLPLHYLANAEDFRESAAEDILKLLLDASPQSAREWVDGELPIHIAISFGKSDEFCGMLIDAHPESLGIQTESGSLPIHLACDDGHLSAVQYLLERDPQSIIVRDADGDLPIHLAAMSSRPHKSDIIKHLLKEDPDCASKPDASHRLPLHLAPCYFYETAGIESVRVLFDAYPEAIDIEDEEGNTPLEIARDYSYAGAERGADVVEFLEAQLAYARQAGDAEAMLTPDQNGWLPLHHALRDNASLGAIKMLLKGNLAALQVVAGSKSSFPLHIACEFSTVDVVRFLLAELGDDFLHVHDAKRDSTLHYACRGGNLGVVKYLLERRVPSVSEPDIDGKLPIHLLWDSDAVDRHSLEYVEANWLLLLAYPETVSY